MSQVPGAILCMKEYWQTSRQPTFPIMTLSTPPLATTALAGTRLIRSGKAGLLVHTGLRSTILVGATFLSFGLVDLWSDSMDTLIITLLAVVICMVVGIPLGIWMARRKAVSNAVTPVLDIMQTFPPFCYLAPLALFFGIGSACALVLTIIYALPPLVRITEHGIRSVSPTT